MAQLRGRYPGGPSRKGTDDSSSGPREKVRLATVDELDAKILAGANQAKKKAKRKQVFLGVAFFVVVAGAVGGYLGFSAHVSETERAQEMTQEQRGSGTDLEQQADRLINEMWKSEALEKGSGIR